MSDKQTIALVFFLILGIGIPTFFTFLCNVDSREPWVGKVAMAATWPLWIVPLGLVAAYKQVSKVMTSIVSDDKR